jgi:hypothetical protein
MKRIWNKVVYYDDPLLGLAIDWVESDWEWVEDDAPVALCKGDETAKQTELMQQQNMAQQMAFNQQLIGIFNKQYADQKAVLDYLKGKFQPMIDNPTGYSDSALAAMRTSATDQLSNQYQNARSALQDYEFQNGGRDLPSGVNSQLMASLLNSEASDKASTQNNITMADENLKQMNYWNAVNALQGNAAMLAPQSYAGAATSAADSAVGAGNSVANLSQAYAQSKKGFWSNLGNAFGSALGSGLGGWLGGMGTKIPGMCWVAAAVFGEDLITGIRVNLVRNYLINDFGKRWYGFPLVWLYAKTGKWVARQRVLVKMLKPVFELALRKAQEKN